MNRVKRKGIALLAALLVMLPLPTAAQPALCSAESPAQTQSTGGRMAAVLGGTVAGVTGMWITLYRRGKK